MDLIDSLVRYVKEIKPYHTKIYGVDVEYRTRDDVNVTIDEDLKLNVWLGVPVRDTTKFNWTLGDLNFPTDINLVPFLRSRGAYISPQSLWDKNYPTDAGLGGGIIVLNTTDKSFIVKGDLRSIFENITTFGVTNQDGVISVNNNGWFTVDDVSYDPNTDTTEITVLETITEGVTTNRILLSLGGGIVVLNTTVRSFIVMDDLRFIFENVTTFEVNDQDGITSGNNNDWFTVDYVSYDPNTNTTEIVVLESLTEGVTTNRILLSDWDGIAWDSSLIIDENAYRKAGMMYENIAVSFSEELLFTFQSIPAVDHSVIGHSWDQYLEGIDILEYTSTSIILQGDATIPLTVLSTFEVVGSDLNDGTYGVLSFTYDPVLDETTVVVTIGPDAGGTGGKAKFGLWEGLEWDGESYYYFHTPPPKADMCATTGIGEDFIVTLGFGWDDNRDGGWDSGWEGGLNDTSWDYAEQHHVIESLNDMSKSAGDNDGWFTVSYVSYDPITNTTEITVLESLTEGVTTNRIMLNERFIVLDTTDKSFIVNGDLRFKFEKVTTFEVNDQDGIDNIGWFTVDYVSYDPNTNTTEITVIESLTEGVTTNRIMMNAGLDGRFNVLNTTDISFIVEDDLQSIFENVTTFEVNNSILIPTHTPVIANPTDDEHWQNDPSNSIPYTWNDSSNMWEPTTLGAVWEFALTPKQQPYNWSKGLRASLLRVTLDPDPNQSYPSSLPGNVILFNVAGNEVGSAPFDFTDLNEPMTIDIIINNNADYDYSRLLVETALSTLGLRISYIEFDPQ